jgi:hypothetical protein
MQAQSTSALLAVNRSFAAKYGGKTAFSLLQKNTEDKQNINDNERKQDDVVEICHKIVSSG